MSSRKSPSGPASSFTGFVVLAATAIAATTSATVAGTAQIAVGPAGTAFGTMNGLKMSTNDIVSVSPRTSPISTSPSMVFSHARVSSINTAGIALIELTFGNLATASTVTANTWNVNVDLQSSDL